MRGWLGTLDSYTRFEVPETHPDVALELGRSYIYAFFHEMILFPTYHWASPQFCVLISDHADGELITQVVHRLGYRTVRGSSTRGGVRALKQMLGSGRHGHLVFTPDGPKGPRRTVQPGVVYLSSRLGMPIVPFASVCASAWHARSWDRFEIPKPYGRVATVFLPAVEVPPDADRDELERHRIAVQERMLEATSQAETWARSLAPEFPAPRTRLRRGA
jgi:lysophospholipid acyltransferase (LPLAT)-like uncharacterized protein